MGMGVPERPLLVRLVRRPQVGRPGSRRTHRRRHQGDRRGAVAQNPYTADETIRVDVNRNVVILTGDVSTVLAKRAAGDDAWDTPGVVDVSNQLAVPALAGPTS